MNECLLTADYKTASVCLFVCLLNGVQYVPMNKGPEMFSNLLYITGTSLTARLNPLYGYVHSL